MSSISENIRLFLQRNSDGKFSFNRTDAYATNNFKVISDFASNSVLTVKDTNITYLLKSNILKEAEYIHVKQLISMIYFLEYNLFNTKGVKEESEFFHLSTAKFEIIVENEKEYEYSFNLKGLVFTNTKFNCSVNLMQNNYNNQPPVNSIIRTVQDNKSIINITLIDRKNFDKVYDTVLSLYDKSLQDKVGMSLTELTKEDITTHRITQLLEMIEI